VIGWLFRWRGERHYLDEDRVLCPRFGNIDLERCLRCPLLLEVTRDSQPHIRCAGLPTDIPDAALGIGG